jgi:signal transduction histidine kinase
VKQPVSDVAIAAALFVIGLTEVWVPWHVGGVGTVGNASRAVETVMTGLFTAPLVLRRRQAVAACVGVCCALAAQVLFVDPHLSLFAGLLPLMISVYSASTYGAARRRVYGLVAAFAIDGVLIVRIPEERASGELLFGIFIITGVWVVGDLVRSRQLRAEHATSHVLRVEAERDAWAIEVLAEERARIARELHDVIAHGVSLMGVQAAAARALLDSDLDGARAALRAVEDCSRESVAELQRLLGVLRDVECAPALEPQPGMARLRDLAADMRSAGMVVELQIEGEERYLPPGVDLTAYRIVQEALTNTLKHAGAAAAEVRVRYRAAELVLEIVDNGQTSSTTARHGQGQGHGHGQGQGQGHGHGLVGMRERVALYGGSLQVGPTSVGGFAVNARLPVPAVST